MERFMSILNSLIGNSEMDFEKVYTKMKKNYPVLTVEEFKKITVQENLLCVQVNNEPLKLKRKGNKPVPLPPNQNPNQKP